MWISGPQEGRTWITPHSLDTGGVFFLKVTVWSGDREKLYSGEIWQILPHSGHRGQLLCHESLNCITVDLQCYISFRCTAWWFNIYIDYIPILCTLDKMKEKWHTASVVFLSKNYNHEKNIRQIPIEGSKKS